MDQRREGFTFSARIDPETLTEDTIKDIVDGIAQQIAREVALAREAGGGISAREADEGASSFHVRFGGEHNKGPFSRTAEHTERGPSFLRVGTGGVAPPS